MTNPKPPRNEALMSRDEVLALANVKYPTLWRWMAEGKFPLARKVGDRKIQWLRAEVEEWMATLPVNQVTAGRGQPRQLRNTRHRRKTSEQRATA